MPDEVDDLYGLPHDRFVAERDALAKRLRAGGRRDQANEVKALRRPSVAAWGVNQVVRSQGRAARELWKAGDALIAAQDALLAGRGDAKALRTATEREREALDTLVDAARGLLTGEGRDLGAATLERVRETLHAAAVDPEGREDVAAGRAVKERAHAGLGAFEAMAATEAPAKTPVEAAPKRAPHERAKGKGAAAKGAAAKGAAPKDAAAERKRAEEERKRAEAERREQAEREERERKEAARRRAAAERELREAERTMATAERKAERADQRHAEAQEAADEAAAELDAARLRAASAADALERARADER